MNPYCDRFLQESQKHFTREQLALLEHCLAGAYLTGKIEGLKDGSTIWTGERIS